MKSSATETDKLAVVVHVVHDYANLVSSGTMAVNDSHNDVRLAANSPLNHHVGEAFLMNCRKLCDFFNPRKNSRDDDIHAKDFQRVGKPFDLPTWVSWHDTMDKQLLHVTSDRGREWKGHQENLRFLTEFKTEWKKFLNQLDEPHKSEFDRQIASKLGVKGYEHLDLS